MQRLTIPYVKQLRTGVACNIAINRLSEYEDIGYTPEELKLCLDAPNVLYIIGDEIDNEKIHPVYPVDEEQVEFCKGDVYWNCRDEFGDCVELPLSGLHTDYFLTSEEAAEYLNRQSETTRG